MKMYLKFFAVPLLVAVIASGLYLSDALIGGLFVDGGSFMWAAFAIWTIFYSAKFEDRIRGLIGVVVGFLCATLMMAITNSFTVNIYTVSLSCLLGVFVVNFGVMFMDKLKKFWLNSLSGIFAGIFLTFSGFGVALNPLANGKEFFVMSGILVTYTILGLLCGFLSTYYTNKINKKLENLK